MILEKEYFGLSLSFYSFCATDQPLDMEDMLNATFRAQVMTRAGLVCLLGYFLLFLVCFFFFLVMFCFSCFCFVFVFRLLFSCFSFLLVFVCLFLFTAYLLLFWFLLFFIFFFLISWFLFSLFENKKFTKIFEKSKNYGKTYNMNTWNCHRGNTICHKKIQIIRLRRVRISL